MDDSTEYSADFDASIDVGTPVARKFSTQLGDGSARQNPRPHDV